jgi:hypothetical protein
VTREQLEHAIRASGYVARDPELVVLGSQAILTSPRASWPCSAPSGWRAGRASRPAPALARRAAALTPARASRTVRGPPGPQNESPTAIFHGGSITCASPEFLGGGRP